MASWPGIIPTRSRPNLVRDAWGDTKSEIYIPKAPSSRGSPMEQGNGVWKGQLVFSSASSGTLDPVSPFPSERSAPRTTSTVPLSRDALADESNRNKDRDHNATPHITDDQWPRSPPSPQHTISFQNETIRGRNNSTKLAELLDEVLNLNEIVSTSRIRARELRLALRHKREEEDDLRLALRNKLNLSSPETVHSETSAINHAIESLQDTTASYMLLENDYHKYEDELGQKEYMLEKRMTKLKIILGKQATSLVQQHQAVGSDSDSPASYTSDAYANNFSSQEVEYLSLVGEARMLRERLTELEGEYLALRDQQDLRERIGLLLDKEALGFVETYEDEKRQIETELDIVLRQIQDHPEHAKHSQEEVRETQWQEVIRDYLPEPPENQAPVDWLRVSEFDDGAPFFEPAGQGRLNKAEFINRWLLHQLRHSKFEILRFKSSPELVDLVDRGWSGDTISQMAFMMWFRDETAQMVGIRSHSAG